MTSGILYLAIVGMWAVVLVPMWLRRDAEDTETAERPSTAHLSPQRQVARHIHTVRNPVSATGSRLDGGAGAGDDESDDGDSAGRDNATGGPVPDETSPDEPSRTAEPVAVAPGGGRRRARVLARRRRRLSGILLLLITAIVLVATQLTPWWIIVAPVTMLAGYMSLLRAAASVDADRRRARMRRMRIQAERRAGAEARTAPEPGAEVIDITQAGARRRDEPYDQYEDARLRAVGD